MLPLTILAVALGAAAPRAIVADGGVLRYADNGDEVALFGVNYYAPFVWDYTGIQALGHDHRRVIDQDLLHLQRLGLDLLRLHVFDRELSDAEGNLVANEHLELLDYLLARARELGFHAVLTPIAWWPTPGDIGGFSSRYTMAQMVADPAAREAQRRYLRQFVEHVNPHTGLAYGQDPMVAAIELINEPIPAPGTPDDVVTGYIQALTQAVREAGCRKPIFYNGWGGRHQAVVASGIEGCTFNWYPTGLQSGATILENVLGLVNRHPELHDPALDGLCKGFYEFDPADVQGPYVYPAMARSFRAGGAQFAAQFQYDAWPVASSNANWDTHYLSLPYGPGKALSFAIAAEAFRRLPRGGDYGATPEADRFGPFRVSFAEQLSEMATEEAFLYSASTTTAPPAPESLERVAGVGSSPVVSYEGTGAYFLDREAPGVWRLEVYPDAVLVDDPYSRVSLGREVSRILWSTRAMRLRLPDLGDAFTVTPLDAGNTHRPEARGGALDARPGVYRLARPGAAVAPAEVAEFFAPPEAAGAPPRVWHRAADALIAGEPAPIEATVTADGAPLVLLWRDGERWQREPMERRRPYAYEGRLPEAALQAGRAVEYCLLLEGPNRALRFPGPAEGWPSAGPSAAAQRLFAASELTEAPELTLGGALPGEAYCRLEGEAVVALVPGFDPDSRAASAFRVPLRPAARVQAGETGLRIRARGRTAATSQVEVGFVLDDGSAFGCNIPLSAGWTEVTVTPTDLRPLWQTPGAARFDPTRLREASFVWGVWLFGNGSAQPHGVEVASIDAVPVERLFRVPVEPLGPPVPLLRAGAVARRRLQGAEGGSLRAVEGPGGLPALEIRHPGFGAPPAAIGIHGAITTTPERRAAMARCDAVRARIRGLTPAANRIELILFEEDGTPWGTTAIPITGDWAEVTVPLASFELFRHFHPPIGRGGDGDRPRPGSLARFQITIGSWLHPEAQGAPWALQVAAVDLVTAD